MAAAVETPVKTEDTTTVVPSNETDEQRALRQCESLRARRACGSDSDVPRTVEFYFDDANLPYDKFMWKLHSQTPEHWIPIATVASFKRMREFTRKHHPTTHSIHHYLTPHA